MTTEAVPASVAAPRTVRRLEMRISKVLTAGTLAGVVALAVGVAAMALAGVSPLSGGGRLDPSAVAADVFALRSEGFLWIGLVVLVATPSARVAATLVGFALAREARMALVALAVLVVIALSVVLGRSGG